MYIKRFVFNPFGENTYVIWSEDKKAAIIDPGMMSDSENSEIKKFIDGKGLTPVHLINTHMHVDHVAGDSFIEKTYGLLPECNKDDDYLAQRVCQQAEMFGVPYVGENLRIGTNLYDNEIIRIGGDSLKVLTVPGHTKGHIAIYCEASGFVVSGDVLFKMSIGRTDLPGGDFGTLIHSIESKLLTLPAETVVYPGHGEPTTIGYEMRNNPYL